MSTFLPINRVSILTYLSSFITIDQYCFNGNISRTNFRVIWSIAGEISPPEEFLTSFEFAMYLCDLNGTFFLQQLVSKFLISLKSIF